MNEDILWRDGNTFTEGRCGNRRAILTLDREGCWVVTLWIGQRRQRAKTLPAADSIGEAMCVAETLLNPG